MATIAIKVCPWCDGKFRSRRRGLCPGCLKPVEIYKMGRGKNARTVWVAEKPSTVALVNRLERKIKLHNDNGFFSFGGWNSSAYRAALAMGKVLVDRCDANQELAEEVIDCYFLGLRNIYPVKSMAGTIGKQFRFVLATAQKRLAERRKTEAGNTARLKASMQNELNIRYTL